MGVSNPRLRPNIDHQYIKNDANGASDLKSRSFYEFQARDLLKRVRLEKKLTYAQLAERLQEHGAVLETRALINKINRGRFTFAFALQVMAALDMEVLKLPNLLIPSRSSLPETGVWISPKAPKTRKTWRP